MNKKNTPTPDQLRAIFAALLEIYSQDTASGSIEQPHFERVEADGKQFKAGYYIEDTKPHLYIRITDRGKSNGQ